MSEREDVLQEFGLAMCDKGDTCDHYDCVGERVMADEIVRLRALPPAPRVVVTDWYVTVDKSGYSYMDHAERNRADVEEEAKLLDDAYPQYAPHRVARVALVSEEAITEAPADALDALEAASAKAQSAGFTELHDLEAPADGA